MIQGGAFARTGEVESPYRGSRVSPAGETRGRLREGLRKWVSEVEMFAGCLKDDGIDDG